MFRKQLPAALFALALSACGGESGTTNAGTPTAGGGTPVQAPGAPPLGSTQPPASPVYVSARDFSKDRAVEDFGVRIQRFRTNARSPWQTESLVTTTTLGVIGFTYRANPKSYHAVFLGEAEDFTRITPTAAWVGDQDYRLDDPNPVVSYFRAVQHYGSDPLYDLEYVGLVAWNYYNTLATRGAEIGEREIRRLHLYGAITEYVDLPTTGSSNYRSKFTPLIDRAESFDITMNWATEEMTASARIPCSSQETCSGPDIGDIRLVGRFDGFRRILGTVSGSAGYTGTFVGGFYGPRALEIGIVGELRHATRTENIFFTMSKRRD